MPALILAGGRSSRMGRDKAMIPIQGVPMLRRVYDVAVQCCPPVYVISPWSDRYRLVLPDACRFISESTEQDGEHPGPLVAFCQGLQYILGDQTLHFSDGSSDWILVLACDLPKLQPGILQLWQAQLATVSPLTMAALPTHPTKGWQPLCGFYHRRCLSGLADFLASGGRSFQQWLRIHDTSEDGLARIQPLSCPDATVLFNCNTSSDLATLVMDESDRAR